MTTNLTLSSYDYRHLLTNPDESLRSEYLIESKSGNDASSLFQNVALVLDASKQSNEIDVNGVSRILASIGSIKLFAKSFSNGNLLGAQFCIISQNGTSFAIEDSKSIAEICSKPTSIQGSGCFSLFNSLTLGERLLR